MKDERKTKKQLIEELAELRRENTELKAAEAAPGALEKTPGESEEKLRLLLQNIPAFVAEVDLDGKMLTLNKAVAGYSIRDLIGKSIYEVTHPSIVEQVKSAFSEVLRTGKTVEFEAFGLGPGGTTAWYHRYFMPILDDDEVQSMMIIISDITERKRAEEELRESEEKYRSYINNSPEGVFVINSKGEHIEVNPAACEITGYSEAELLSMYSRDLVAPEARDGISGRIRELFEKGSMTAEVLCIRKDGGRIFLKIDAAQIAKDRFISFCSDVTERVQAEEELKKHRDTLEEIVEERTQELHDTQEQLIRNEKLAALGVLAGGVGHELRNPLTGINNAIYFLKTILPDADEKVKEHLGIASEEVDNAEKIISNLLDFGRMQEFIGEKTHLDALVAQVLEKTSAPENVKVSAQIAANLPDVFIDPLQINQALGNLVANAYQAMPDGGKLTIKAGKKGKQVHLSVTDNGEGISDENLKKIFEPLFTTKARGIGLGLALSKRLVEGNGGEIKVESQEGKGSTFTVILPTVEGTG